MTSIVLERIVFIYKWLGETRITKDEILDSANQSAMQETMRVLAIDGDNMPIRIWHVTSAKEHEDAAIVYKTV